MCWFCWLELGILYFYFVTLGVERVITEIMCLSFFVYKCARLARVFLFEDTNFSFILIFPSFFSILVMITHIKIYFYTSWVSFFLCIFSFLFYTAFEIHSTILTNVLRAGVRCKTQTHHTALLKTRDISNKEGKNKIKSKDIEMRWGCCCCCRRCCPFLAVASNITFFFHS